MKKKRILSIILIVIIFAAGISSVVLYKLGDRIFNEMIDLQISEIEDAIQAAQETVEPAPANEGQDQPQTEIKDSNGNVISTINPTPVEVPTTETTQPDKKPVIEVPVTKDKLQDVKESISTTDKMKAATLVLSKLSQADINHLTKLSSGGITAEEKAEMKAILYSRFTAAEIEEIRAMYIKYMN